MFQVPPHDIVSVLDKCPADVEDNAETERNKSLPLEVTLLDLSGQDEEAANVVDEYQDTVDNKPGYEEV